MTQRDAEPTKVNFRGAFIAIVVTQFVLVNLLAPGDGGRWLRYVIVTLALFYIVVYLVFYSGPRQRIGADPGLSLPGALTMIVGSVVCVVFATFLIGVLPLP